MSDPMVGVFLMMGLYGLALFMTMVEILLHAAAIL